jgi:uroporphyrinogen-III synthase
LKDWSGKQFSGLYLCGVERSFDFSSTFAQFGKMELCEVYRFNELFPAQDMLETALESMVGGAILVYSAEGAKRIIRAFERANKLYVLKEAVIVAISGKAAKAFNSNATKQILIAAEPTEAEMLKVLKNLQT